VYGFKGKKEIGVAPAKLDTLITYFDFSCTLWGISYSFSYGDDIHYNPRIKEELFLGVSHAREPYSSFN